ncbi:MAG: hypothetical protein IKA47_10915 [Oscillospiraceae bacterium]|nr:hypothetical protein [Oscillospiraceae bacterium]
MQKFKKIVSLLLLTALMLSCVPPVHAAGEKTYCAYGHTSHNGITCDAELITWSAWPETTSLPTTGNYYLTGDVTISSASSPSDLNLDLNGCNITRTLSSSSTGSACNVFSVATGKSFLLTDTNAERTGIVSVSFGGSASVGNSTLGKIVKVSPNATMKLYGGIIDGSNIIGNTKNNVTNATINIENGTDKNDAAFYMYGGKVVGFHNYNESNGTKTYYNGSAIIARGGTTLEIRGGEVVGGTSKNGACIYSNTNNTRILGGTLVGGKVSSAGACMYVNAQTVTMGDVVSDGGIYIYASAAKLILTGAPQIAGTCSSGYGICFGASSTGTVDATGLSKDARINIKNNRSTLTSAILKVDEDLSECFTFVNPNYRAKYDASAQTISMEYYIATNNTACKCSTCNGTIPQWTVWDGTAKAGHYYLESDMALTETLTFDDAAMVLNLNGYTLSKTTAGAMFQLRGNATLAIMDGSSDASGAMVGTAGEGVNGSLIATESANAAAEIYGGTFSVSNPTVKAGKGALVYAAAGSVTIAGGVFKAGSANNGDTLYAAPGSSLTIKGAPKMEGGVEIGENVNVSISETPLIRKEKNGSAYSLKTASAMKVGILSVGARILVTGTEEFLLADEFVNTNAFDTKNYFTADSENMRIKEVNGAIKLVPIVIDEAVIQARRDTVEAYMRAQATLLWQATEDITYCFSTSTDDPAAAPSSRLIHIKAGRIYMGLPYSYSATTPTSFLDYAGEPDENGIYPISGLTYQILSGSSSQTRMGNDCSSSVASAWSQIGASVYATTSSGYVPRYGIVNIGDYIPEESYTTGTAQVIEKNGAEVMYESYALLQKADALARWKSANNHTMMVVTVNVVRNSDGSINPTSSYVTVLEQTSTNVKNERTKTVEGVGTVYEIYGVDKKYTFEYLVNNTYIPVTCMELVDAAPLEEAVVTDSIDVATKDNLFEGSISCNNFIDCITITITDENGNVVQKAAQSPYRGRQREFVMSEFITGQPKNWSRGIVDLDTLPVGEYHCDVVCRLTTGATYTVRSFDINQTDSSAVIFNATTGKGYTTVADALTDCADGDALKLLASVNGDLTITKSITLDLNGYNIVGNFTANGCQLLDSQTDDYTVKDSFGYGKITGSIIGAAPLDGYLYVKESDGQSFHKITVNMDKVTLRAGSAGIYYTGEFLYDEVLAQKVTAYGVTMSTSNKSPVADDTDSTCKYTTSATSTLLSNILSGSADDANNATMNVYASAYVKFTDGSIQYSESTATNLKALVETIDGKLWNSLSAAQQEAMLQMYETYEDVMRSWNIPNIKNAAQ